MPPKRKKVENAVNAVSDEKPQVELEKRLHNPEEIKEKEEASINEPEDQKRKHKEDEKVKGRERKANEEVKEKEEEKGAEEGAKNDHDGKEEEENDDGENESKRKSKKRKTKRGEGNNNNRTSNRVRKSKKDESSESEDEEDDEESSSSSEDDQADLSGPPTKEKFAGWTTREIVQHWELNPPLVSASFPAPPPGSQFLGATYGFGQWKYRDQSNKNIWYNHDDYINAIYEYNYRRGARKFNIKVGGIDYEVSLDHRSQRQVHDHTKRYVVTRD